MFFYHDDMNGVISELNPFGDGMICRSGDQKYNFNNNLKVIPYKIQFKRDQQIEKPFVLVKMNDKNDSVEQAWL